jgi:hypothetical protein
MSELTEAMESRDAAPLRVAVREGRVDVVRVSRFLDGGYPCCWRVAGVLLAPAGEGAIGAQL